MRESEVDVKIQEWQVAGFKFLGNGFENDEDNPQDCPCCGEYGHIFWAIWEHPTLYRDADEDADHKMHLLNGTYHCFDCDHWWVDEDPKPKGVDHVDANRPA